MEKKEPSGSLDNYECEGQMSIYDFPQYLPAAMQAERIEHVKKKKKTRVRDYMSGI